MLPRLAAMCIADLPLESSICGLAPAASRALTISNFLYLTAKCRGVQPSLVAASMSTFNVNTTDIIHRENQGLYSVLLPRSMTFCQRF